MSTKILELSFAPEQLPSSLEIIEIANDRFALTNESLASLTESQLQCLDKTVSINNTDHQRLVDLRADLIKSIDEDLLSMKTLQLNSMGDTNTVYSEINPGDDSILANDMPDVMSYFNTRIDSALERKGDSAQLSGNFLRTSIILATTDSPDLQHKDRDMILEAKVNGDHFKSNFYEICG